jgi:hypothetical protein
MSFSTRHTSGDKSGSLPIDGLDAKSATGHPSETAKQHPDDRAELQIVMSEVLKALFCHRHSPMAKSVRWW